MLDIQSNHIVFIHLFIEFLSEIGTENSVIFCVFKSFKFTVCTKNADVKMLDI